MVLFSCCISEYILTAHLYQSTDFWTDMDKLNVRRPDATLRVTEHMDEIIQYVERLVDQVSPRGLYSGRSRIAMFDSSSNSQYMV